MSRWQLCVLAIVGALTACRSVVSPTDASPSSSAGAVPSGTPASPRPCSFLSQATAAQISGDSSVANRATDVTEEYGYVACIFADAKDEANSVAVQIKRVSGGVGSSELRDAATFFSRGEAVQPYQPFSAAGIGDDALGETTMGVAFVLFSRGDLLVYVGAGSSVVSANSLRVAVISLAGHIAAALKA